MLQNLALNSAENLCKAGSFSTGDGCELCGENTFSDAGASSCTQCPDGRVSAAGSTSQDDCYYG